MKTFLQYITENVKFRRKGWVNVKTGDLSLYAMRGRTIRPYHDEIVVNNLSDFGGDALKSRWAETYGFEDGDEETEKMWTDLKRGRVDRDSNLDSLLASMGWHRVVFDEGISSIEIKQGGAPAARKAAKIVYDKLDWNKHIEFLEIYERGYNGEGIDLNTERDLISYIKTGKPAPRQTEIGRTMAMFRGESVLESKRGEMLIGWVEPNNKMHLHIQGGRMGKYHTQILTNLKSFEELRPFMSPRIGQDIENSMEKFVRSGDMTKDQLEHIVTRSYESLYNRLKDGKIDGDYELEEKLQENGWTKIRIERRSNGVSSISCAAPKRCHATARMLDKELGGWQGINTNQFWMEDLRTTITDEKTWDIYIKTGRIPKRTDIGSTMARFR